MAASANKLTEDEIDSLQCPDNFRKLVAKAKNTKIVGLLFEVFSTAPADFLSVWERSKGAFDYQGLDPAQVAINIASRWEKYNTGAGNPRKFHLGEDKAEFTDKDPLWSDVGVLICLFLTRGGNMGSIMKRSEFENMDFGKSQPVTSTETITSTIASGPKEAVSTPATDPTPGSGLPLTPNPESMKVGGSEKDRIDNKGAGDTT